MNAEKSNHYIVFHKMIGRVYKITSSQTDKVYIGSTKQKLWQRISVHRCQYKSGSSRYTAKEILKYEDNQIELIEEVEVETKKDLERIEADYILKYGDKCVNRLRIIGYDNSKDRNKHYYETNKEKIAQFKSEKIICECGAQVCRNYLASHKRTKKHLNSIDR